MDNIEGFLGILSWFLVPTSKNLKLRGNHPASRFRLPALIRNPLTTRRWRHVSRTDIEETVLAGSLITNWDPLFQCGPGSLGTEVHVSALSCPHISLVSPPSRYRGYAWTQEPTTARVTPCRNTHTKTASHIYRKYGRPRRSSPAQGQLDPRDRCQWLCRLSHRQPVPAARIQSPGYSSRHHQERVGEHLLWGQVWQGEL